MTPPTALALPCSAVLLAGWKRMNDFGVPFVRQGGGKGLFGTLTWSELRWRIVP